MMIKNTLYNLVALSMLTKLTTRLYTTRRHFETVVTKKGRFFEATL